MMRSAKRKIKCVIKSSQNMKRIFTEGALAGCPCSAVDCGAVLILYEAG